MDGLREYEAEVIAGIEPFAKEELRAKLGAAVSDIRLSRAGFLRFHFHDCLQQFSALRAVTAVYCVYDFYIPRPKAFLGHQHFTRLVHVLRESAATFPAPPRTLGIGAAGADSSVMRRLRRELSEALNLQPAEDGKGELFLRLLRQRRGDGWQVLVRTTPQPLSKRAYRRVDIPGALNAAVAYVMTQACPAPDSATVLNLCSGTSTILIEFGLTQDFNRLIAVDNSRNMIEAGRTNAESAGLGHRIQHVLADATRAPLPAQSADIVFADLPFGHHIGTHDTNIELYPSILDEASRLARAEANFVVLTHEVDLMRRCLDHSRWKVVSETRINLNGLHPRLFVLKQNSNRI